MTAASLSQEYADGPAKAGLGEMDALLAAEVDESKLNEA